jgi:CBS domain-containing protein
MQLKEVMTRGVDVIPPEATVQDAAAKLKQLDTGPVPICDGERLGGILTDRDITGDLAVGTGDQKVAGEVLEQVSEPAEPQR